MDASLRKSIAVPTAKDASQNNSLERSVVLGSVLLLHVALIWLIQPRVIPLVHGAEPTTTAIVFSFVPGPKFGAEDIPTNFVRPSTGSIGPPSIEITADKNVTRTNSGNGAILPPRLDPQWINTPSALPADLRAQASGIPAVIVVVRALVLETGAVGATEISGSSGFADIDAFAAEELKKKWRFLPAVAGGRPIRDWVTVQVLLKPA